METVKTTDEKGVVTWTNLDDAVYLVVETAHPVTVSESSVPFYVILPYTYTRGDIAGTTTRDVFVYPKNEMASATLYTVKVSGGNTSDRRKNATYEVAAAGEEIDFYSSFELGVTTEEITELTIVDTSDDALSVPTKAADVEITLGTTVFIPVTDYTLTKDAAANKFTIEFTDTGLAAARSAYGTNGTTMGLSYSSTFSGTVPKEYRNTIKATTNDSNPDSGAISSEDFAKITTGSAKITKYKADGETPLEGVTFRLTDSEGNTKDVTTDEDGIAYWEGLGDGTYTIQEVATVGGYTLNPKAKTFRIADIVDDVDEDNTDLNWVGEMNNYEQPRLPLTGGTGITIIALTGIALIGRAVLLIKRKNVAK